MAGWERARRLPLAAEIALSFAAGAGTFTLSALVLAGVDAPVVAGLLGIGYLVAVIAIARFASIAYAVPVGMAAMLAFDWFYLPPTHPLEFPDSVNLLDLVVYLAVSVLLGGLAAHAARRATAAERARGEIADEQAGLRRVATLVARGAAPAETFGFVAAEIGQLYDAEVTVVLRYESDRTGTVVGLWSVPGAEFPHAARLRVDGVGAAAMVLETGRPVRTERFEGTEGSISQCFAQLGARSGVGAPITVDGRLWGAVVAATTRPDGLPVGSEEHIAAFTELVATAISNAQAHQDLRLLADEQAALRRVATLVAKESSPTEVFAKVAEEAAGVFGEVDCALLHDEGDGTANVVAVGGAGLAARYPVGTRLPVDGDGDGVAALVLREGRARRIDDYASAPGPVAAGAREQGIGSAVGCPVVVGERRWGAIVVARPEPEPLPPETEARIAQFADLVATAIANAEARAEVARLAEEQAALRRVATLVAEGAAPPVVFDAVAAEMESLLDADHLLVCRYEPGIELTVLAHRGSSAEEMPPGVRISHEGDSVEAVVRRSGSSARMESYEGARGMIAELARAAGLRVAVGAPIVVDGRLWGVVSAGWNREHSPPADTEQRMALFAQLVDTAIANADSRAELIASRARLVAAADDARRRFERDLHDGVQQRLVSLALDLHGAEAITPSGNDLLAAQLARINQGLVGALDELRDLSRGIHPAILSEGGLTPALKALARRSAVPVQLDLAIDERLGDHVEVAAFYVVSEALTNAAKHARASTVEVSAQVDAGILRLTIGDDGVGGADPARGSGLTGLTDRVTALGGTIGIASPPTRGTSLRVELPIVSQ
ncbi:GAF domain-containing protein [Kribbella orskensis]|uniref:histidine kinase n=1 Tax=Kribbella orskensis TaxID=2512216 RepID=A0ABY2BAA5_9ACTN|nr:GAF domain-containing protein [Kribbella sp. VKM Ac-2500]TCO13243.1 GAF domain-containing protein [Kribbella orskensis]